jgi:hypothetical protein
MFETAKQSFEAQKLSQDNKQSKCLSRVMSPMSEPSIPDDSCAIQHGGAALRALQLLS